MALGTLVALSTACTDAGSPFFIVQNSVPGDGCAVTASLSTFLPRGIIDANAGAGYVFTPVAQNASVAVDDEGLHIVFVEGADVDLTIQSGFEGSLGTDRMSELTSFSKRFSGAIQPDNGLTAFRFTVIPEELLTDHILPSLAEDVLLEVGIEVTLFGTFAGGHVTSKPFTYWVDVCNGCMKRNVGACADLPSDFEASTGGECVLLQDTVLDCCTQPDSTELCPAVPAEEEV